MVVGISHVVVDIDNRTDVRIVRKADRRKDISRCRNLAVFEFFSLAVIVIYTATGKGPGVKRNVATGTGNHLPLSQSLRINLVNTVATARKARLSKRNSGE